MYVKNKKRKPLNDVTQFQLAFSAKDLEVTFYN